MHLTSVIRVDRCCRVGGVLAAKIKGPENGSLLQLSVVVFSTKTALNDDSTFKIIQ